MSSLKFIFLAFLLCFFSRTKSDDLQILTKLKTSLQNSNTHVFKTWEITNHISNFTGITCNSDGFVTEIDLSHQKLSGVVPFDSVCQLHSLEKLALGFNSLQGSVTEDLNNCVNLKYLDLGNNIFSGSFPNIHFLSKLQFLHLNLSGFSGKFPWNSLQNMTELIELSVGDNGFDNSTFPIEVTNLNKLNWLYLANCSLQGEIPNSIGNLTQLLNLELSSNSLSGIIPMEITKLQNLWQLELYSNELTGILPVGLRNLTKLKNFDASANHLHGDLSELRFLTNLVTLQVFENEFSGEIPAEFGDFKSLTNLSLYTNKLTGSLPQSLGSWSEFNFIDASENFLTGPIPPNMCKKGTMQKLLLLQNNFTGEIPANYGDCLTLTRFRVSDNSLTGVVPPGIWGLPNVNIIDVASNELEGSISSDIGNAVALSELYAGNNRLSGRLPLEISKAKSLITIDLTDNQFSDEIPTTIGELKKLGNLQLNRNRISGLIPESIGSCNSLNILNLAENSLYGAIPSSLGFLPVINSLNFSNNELSGEIPVSFSNLKLSEFDLSNNRLTGKVPESLSIAAYKRSFVGNPGLCSGDDSFLRRCSSNSGMSKDVHKLIICLAVGLLLLVTTLGYFIYLKKTEKDQNQNRSLKEESWDLKSFHVMTFTEDEILDSIKDENLIGKGGSGNVYKVTVSNGKEFAVKHIWNTDPYDKKRHRSTSPMIGKRREKSSEFESEVKTLSSIRHVNVVKLFCSITSEESSLLVYEYMQNGSLWDRLFTSRKMELDWETRYEIAVGAAKGLEYLHHGCDRPVLHRDVKSSNILLDEFFKPKIADFGLAKIVQSNGFKDSTTHVIAGTHGYIAPEYGYTCIINEKSDVYSFGVVLMELVSGKKAIEAEFGESKDIVDWVSSNLKTRESVLSLVDSRILDVYKEDAIKMLRIGILCTARIPTARPTMRSVVQMLEEARPCRLLGIVISKELVGDKDINKKLNPKS